MAHREILAIASSGLQSRSFQIDQSTMIICPTDAPALSALTDMRIRIRRAGHTSFVITAVNASLCSARVSKCGPTSSLSGPSSIVMILLQVSSLTLAPPSSSFFQEPYSRKMNSLHSSLSVDDSLTSFQPINPN